MNDFLWELTQKYKRKGIFVDTQLLLLYLIGSVSPDLVNKFSRTRNFSISDFLLVAKFVDTFEIQITSPHVLTEVSNLFGNRSDFHNVLKKYLETSEEKYLNSFELSKNDAFVKFGLADTAILEISKDSFLVFTDDNPLYGYLINKGVDAINFDQLKFGLG